MVNYLKEIKVEIKVHWEDDAKKLNNQIFEFLQQKLEEIISQFDNSILLHTYAQIEYIEGKRENDKNQMEFDVQKYIAFDINERHNKERLEVSELVISAKHILHTVLKVNPKGSKNISEQDWYYLMAFSKIINKTIQRSDQLHYHLAKSGIEITHSYELIDIDESSEINSSNYYKKTTNSNIILAKNKPLEVNQSNQNESSKDILLFDANLNSAWLKEFEFSLENMVKIIVILGRHIFEENNYFPLITLSIKEINTFIGETLLEIDNKEIEEIISFLSLDFNTYSNYEYIDYSLDRLMKKKERLNLSPFIKVDDKYLFGQQLLLVSFTTWHSTLINGDIPFSIDETSLVKKELNKIHDKLDKELEVLAYEEAVKAVGKEHVRMTINKFQTLSKNYSQKPPCGEIDLLVVNINIKTIFVLDAKNVNKKFHTSAIDRELNKFLKGKKSYLIKLNKKFDFIKENKDEILNHFNIEDKNGWKMKKGFVVNTVYVSAFYKERIDFVLIDDLAKYLQHNEDL
jgi:6-pyruvoyl-tetrahydropterin synthase